ncbi:REP-associated tyrosine transposase [Pseudomonas nunensis]|uniref:REP-associated tyrosine transposase n=1 Tax=Pseudomonas nunensis TaxID=2961896 RepID=UPI0025AF0E44|nr:transposase [Pseudomonas nunensis]MDN3219239.1 transposase [Pseudomonas nunensis]
MHPHPNSHRLRHGRYSEQGRGYLITAVVYQRRRVFSDWRLGRLLVAELRRAHEQQWVNSIAWVVMPDHFHWLVQLEQRSLAQLMQAIKSRSTLSINRASGTRGAFWQSGYHDRAIRDGEELRPFARYIVANPVRAGLVEKTGDYPLWDACWL